MNAEILIKNIEEIKNAVKNKHKVRIEWNNESFTGQIREIFLDENDDPVGIEVWDGSSSHEDYSTRRISICCIEKLYPINPAGTGFCGP